MNIEKWGYFEVTRASIDFIVKEGINSGSELLTTILPFGNPAGKSVKYIYHNNEIYFTLLVMEKEQGGGHGLTVVFDPKNMNLNPITLVDGMEKILKNGKPTEKSFVIEPVITIPEKFVLKNFNAAIFSCLARQKTIILGSPEEVLNVLNIICHSIPQSMFKRLEFVSQTNSLSDNVNIMGMPMSDEVLSELDETKGQYTLVVLGDRVYGQFSSKLTKKIESLIEKEKYEEVKIILNDFYTVIKESDELPQALEFADSKGLHLSDAQLALIMRANFFGKEIPSSLLEV